VEDRIHTGLGHGEKRHRFGEAVDRSTPALSQQKQDRGDQCSCVTDTDPPDEVENVDAPGDGNVDAPQSDTDEQQVRHRQQHQLKQRKRDRKAEEPRQRRLSFQDDRADLVGH
jgi:hypothetical protein